MQIDTAGTYTLKYTAEDNCGNETIEERELIVVLPTRTVLYQDNTLIINELGKDRASNIAKHGNASIECIPFNPDGATDAERYIFADYSNRPWGQYPVHVEIGDTIAPTSVKNWFRQLQYCESFDLGKLDTSRITDMSEMFLDCRKVESLDLSNFDTSRATNMSDMFNSCSVLENVDLSSFNTSSVTNMERMFYFCRQLKTIYASPNFEVSQVTSSDDMFDYMSTNLVGGAGTIWASSNPDNKTYAHIDGGTSNPGYFTLKSA